MVSGIAINFRMAMRRRICAGILDFELSLI
jgi:hypothetical protein